MPRAARPGATLPGAFLQILELGVLLTGPSGIGKSDAVLGLLDRGHRLIADDAVTFAAEADGLQGSCPPALSGRVAARGLGVIDIGALYGPQRLLASARLGLWIELGHEAGDPLSGGWGSGTLLGVELPRLDLPAGGARNLPLLIELAVREHHLRLQGLRADERFIADQRAALTRELI